MEFVIYVLQSFGFDKEKATQNTAIRSYQRQRNLWKSLPEKLQRQNRCILIILAQQNEHPLIREIEPSRDDDE